MPLVSPFALPRNIVLSRLICEWVMEDHQSSDEDYQYFDQWYGDDLEYAKEPGTAEGPTIKVITKETLPTAQEEYLSNLMGALSVGKHQARRLLIFHRWDMENLSKELAEKGKTLLCAEAGVSEERHCDSGSSVSSSVMCEICQEQVPCDQATTMACGHCFCNGCWTEYFIVKIKEGQSRRITCMACKCKYYCNEDIVSKLVSQKSSDMAEKFERFLLESYIEDNKRVKWCPSTPHCGNAIYVEDDDDALIFEVECSCGFQFCFSCLSEPHSPCSCLMRQLWAEKCVDEHTAAWIKNHARPCPNCNRLGSKDGGCGTVTCFCGKNIRWLGGGARTTMDSIDQEAKQDEESSSASAHYYDRYKAHMDSLDEEIRLTESIGKKVNDCFTPGESCSWVNDGLSTLVRSRRFLSYSYPFAFYMFEGGLFKHEISEMNRNLFKYQQQQLEGYVKRLSKILKKPFESDKVWYIGNLSSVIDDSCGKMYEFIQNDLLGSLSHQHGTQRIAPYKLLKQ